MASEFEIAVMEQLSDIKSLATKAAAAAEAANASAVAASTAMTDRLFHPKSGVIVTLQSDIQEIKDARTSEARWDRFHNIAHYSLPPLLTFLHGVARHFGWDV